MDDPAPLLDTVRYHLIGDGGFPLKSWLMVPYRQSGHLSKYKKCFNRKLSSTRSVVERAFGDLKNRFRRCQNIEASIESPLS